MVAPLGRALDAVVNAMVEEGWNHTKARHAVEAVAANAGLGQARATTAGGWRTLAHGTGLPPWQLRRLTVLLCGAPGWPGIVELMVETGHQALRHPAVRSAIRATTNRHFPVPQSHALESRSSAANGQAFVEAS
jgi:hypothetical protein